MVSHEFGRRKSARNRSVGSWSESPCRRIELSCSEESLRTLLSWGAAPDGAPYTHQEIAQWCDRLHLAHLDTENSPEIERVVRIAADVDCQWDLYLGNTYSLKELQQLDFSTVRLPLDWFEGWRSELDAP